MIMTAGQWHAQHVIHTVGLIWKGGSDGERDVLANAYRNSRERAVTRNAETITFPSISAGVDGFPHRYGLAGRPHSLL